MHAYRPKGACSRLIEVDLDGDRIKEVKFVGGCDGNLKAISKIIKGMTVDEVAKAFEGNTCGPRNTSCADQLVHALREAQQAR